MSSSMKEYTHSDGGHHLFKSFQPFIKLFHAFSTGFVPHIDQLFDEEVLIGKGWTTKESLRPLAYSTLADLVHHVRTHLPLPHLSLAVHMFSKNVHDDSLPVSIQTMSCKVKYLFKSPYSTLLQQTFSRFILIVIATAIFITLISITTNIIAAIIVFLPQ